MNEAISVKGLKKSYGDVEAVKGIDFLVEEGSLFAFLGENGAGKSTTINILCTLLPMDEGEVKICGFDLKSRPDEVRKRIGVVFQGSVLDKRLSVKENLSTRAAFYGLRGDAKKKRLSELCEFLGLGDFFNRAYGKLSGGQRRRADVARGLLNDPRVLFLDEPTTGLDPQTRRTVWGLIHKLRKETGLTVFLTTHYMEEAEDADRVVILDEGAIVAEGTPVQLKNEYSSDFIRVHAERSADLDARFERYGFEYVSGFYKLPVRDADAAKKFVFDNGDVLRDFEIVKGNMDDVFLSVTGKRISGGER